MQRNLTIEQVTPPGSLRTAFDGRRGKTAEFIGLMALAGSDTLTVMNL